MRSPIRLLLFSLLLPPAIGFCQPTLTLEQVTQALLAGVEGPLYSGGQPDLVWPHPTLADIDADGDFDLFVGAANGAIALYENQGTPTAFHFVFVTSQYGQLNVGSSAAPAFFDIDNDLDLDLFVGNGSDGGFGGNIRFYENTGTVAVASWVLREDSLAGLDAHDHAVPTLGDVDNDGDADLLVGGGYGSFYYAENTGTANSAEWAAPVMNYGNFFVGFKATPVFADFNCDGKPDLIIGNDTGKSFFRKNLGPDTNGVVQWETVTNVFLGIDFTHFDYTAPACADLDADGDTDALLSEFYGNLNYFENVGDNCAANWNWVSGDLLSGTIDVGQSACPALVDIDGDCDLDLFIGKANGQIRFYRNDGTAAQANWIAVTENFLGFDTGAPGLNPARPIFTDLDFDGDYDLVITGLPYTFAACYQNLYAETGSLNFQFISNNFFSGLLSGQDRPLFADFNEDARMDFAVARSTAPMQQRIIIYYHNGVPDAPWSDQWTDTLAVGADLYGLHYTTLDYDYDGDTDILYISNNQNWPATCVLLRNPGSPGNLSWASEPLAAGISWANAAHGMCWVDIDQDWDWDVFAGNQYGGIKHWKNTSNWAAAGFEHTTNFPDVHFADTLGQAENWYWEFGDGDHSTEQNPGHTYAAAGQYEVCLTRRNGCKATTVCIALDVSPPMVDTESRQAFARFVLAPNPAMGISTLWLEGQPQQEVSITLFNPFGAELYTISKDFHQGVLAEPFDFGQLPAGVYCITATAGGKSQRLKIIRL